MTISSSLNNAVSGLNAATRMTEVISSNISNALTDGYARRTLSLTSEQLGGVGVESVFRHVDRGVLADRRIADAALNGADSLVNMMQRVQDAIGAPGSDTAISNMIVNVEAAFIDATSDPSSTIALSNVALSLSNLSNSLNSASDTIQAMRAEADRSISVQVEQLNASLAMVEDLNTDIQREINSGRDPSSSMDERQRIIDGISEMVPVRELEREGGGVALMTHSGEILLDGSAKVFEFTANTIVTPDMTLASGGLNAITSDGLPISTDGIGRLNGGTLGAAFQARDEDLTAAQAALDDIAADLATRLQDPTVDPSLAIGDPGLLTDAGVAFDVSNTVGMSARIAVNSSVDPIQGGDVTLLRDGINSVVSGSAGDSTLLQAFTGALSSLETTSDDIVPQSAAGRAAAREGEIGQQRLGYETELSYATSRWSILKEAEAANGVDTDQEMQNLLRVEQAYQANARLIQTIQSMLDTLMEL